MSTQLVAVTVTWRRDSRFCHFGGFSLSGFCSGFPSRCIRHRLNGSAVYNQRVPHPWERKKETRR
jgi:hypothetical protein